MEHAGSKAYLKIGGLMALVLIIVLVAGNIQKNSAQSKAPVYRGVVTNISDTEMTVRQVWGFHYGEEEMVFNLTDKTVKETDGREIAADSFVEVQHESAVTMSLPPKSNASKIILISTLSEGIVQNGEIVSFREDEQKNFYITILPLIKAENEDAEPAKGENELILIVPSTAFEGIEAKDLKVGVRVSAVTRGIATMSIPPQYPVHVLLPFKENVAIVK